MITDITITTSSLEIEFQITIRITTEYYDLLLLLATTYYLQSAS